MPGLGEELREAREARGLSPSEVSERIHIRSVYLESLEAEDWSAIAAPVYVRGFIRTYSRFLGVDPEAAVAYFNASVVQREDAAAPEYEPVRIRAGVRRHPSPWLWLATLVAAVLVGFVGYTAFGLRSAGIPRAGPTVVGVTTPQGSAVPSVAPQTTLTPAQRPPPAHHLGIRLTQRSWLLIRIDGTTRLEGILPAGTQRSFRGTTADVRAGNAGGVDLIVNGRNLGIMGRDGDVVERSVSLER